jgi:1,4-alpha-glucan branching enzyme
LKGYAQAKGVKLIGSFNNWRQYELPMTQTKEGWQIAYTLGPGNYEFKFVIDGKVVSDPANQSVSGGNGVLSGSYLVLNPNYTFRLKAFNNAKKVFLAGDFNNWNPNSLLMRHEKDEWVFTAHLYPGKHLYKYIVDGKWILDPTNKLWEQNEYDTGNSVLWVE